MALVSYTGDVLQTGAPVVAHQCNCKGVMGGGIALQIRQKYPLVFSMYKALCKKNEPAKLLGTIQPCLCSGAKERWIVNLFAQDGFGTDKQYTDYEAFEACCRALRSWAIQRGYKKVAMPYGIGCGLAGGDWKVVYGILEKVFWDNQVDVEIWKLHNKRNSWHRD